MENIKVLGYLEKNFRAYKQISKFVAFSDEFNYSDLIYDINTGVFNDYEYLLPIMIMISHDVIIENVMQRLFLQLFIKELEQKGIQSTLNDISAMAEQEHIEFEKDREKFNAVNDLMKDND